MRSSIRYLVLPLSLALGLAATPAGSQDAAPAVSAPVPDTPPARQFTTWLAAFNSGDRAALEEFGSRFANTPPLVDRMLALRQQSGGFDVMKIEQSSETNLVVLMQERNSDQFAQMSMEVEAAPPHRILAAPLRPVPRPLEFAVPRLDDAALGEQVDAFAKKDSFSGSVLIMRGDKPVFSRAYGYADRDSKSSNRLDTKFRYGSMGKMFTAVAVMQLVQAGKIALTDPVGKFLPDYPNKDIATKVTIEQLLGHTGGTGDIFTPEYAANIARLNSHADYVKLYGERAPAFEPGSRYAYSNYGYVLLGRIIEAVSGEDYYRYLQERIFAPAGMLSTGFWPDSQPLAGRAVGYMPTPEGLRPNTGQMTDRGTAAGGGLSTVGDMVRFSRALLNHELLDAEHLAQLTTGRQPMGPNARYALGFADFERGTPLHRIGHSGGAPGMNGDLLIYPEAGCVVVVLSNYSPPAATRVSGFIANRITLAAR